MRSLFDEDDLEENFCNNSTLISDSGNEEMVNYISQRVLTLEESLLHNCRNNNKSTEKDFHLDENLSSNANSCLDVVESLFGEIHLIHENLIKVVKSNNSKNEKLRLQDEKMKLLMSKYSQKKVNNQMLKSHLNMKEEQILKLEENLKIQESEICNLHDKFRNNLIEDNLTEKDEEGNNSSSSELSDSNPPLERDLKFLALNEQVLFLEDLIKQMNNEKAEMTDMMENLRSAVWKKEEIIDQMSKEMEINQDLMKDFNQFKTRLKFEKSQVQNELDVYKRKSLDMNLTEDMLQCKNCHYKTRSYTFNNQSPLNKKNLYKEKFASKNSLPNICDEIGKKEGHKRGSSVNDNICVNSDLFSNLLNKAHQLANKESDDEHSQKEGKINYITSNANCASYANFENANFSFHDEEIQIINEYESYNKFTSHKFVSGNLIIDEKINEQDNESRYQSRNQSYVSKNQFALDKFLSNHSVAYSHFNNSIISQNNHHNTPVKEQFFSRGLSKICLTTALDNLENGLRSTKEKLGGRVNDMSVHYSADEMHYDSYGNCYRKKSEKFKFSFKIFIIEKVENFFLEKSIPSIENSINNQNSLVNTNPNNFNNIININFNNFDESCKKNIVEETTKKYPRSHRNRIFMYKKMKRNMSKRINKMSREIKELKQFRNIKMSSSMNFSKFINEKNADVNISILDISMAGAGAAKCAYPEEKSELMLINEICFDIMSNSKDHQISYTTEQFEIQINKPVMRLDFKKGSVKESLPPNLNTNTEQPAGKNNKYSDAAKNLYYKYFKFTDTLLRDTINKKKNSLKSNLPIDLKFVRSPSEAESTSIGTENFNSVQVKKIASANQQRIVNLLNSSIYFSSLKNKNKSTWMNGKN